MAGLPIKFPVGIAAVLGVAVVAVLAVAAAQRVPYVKNIFV